MWDDVWLRGDIAMATYENNWRPSGAAGSYYSFYRSRAVQCGLWHPIAVQQNTTKRMVDFLLVGDKDVPRGATTVTLAQTDWMGSVGMADYWFPTGAWAFVVGFTDVPAEQPAFYNIAASIKVPFRHCVARIVGKDIGSATVQLDRPLKFDFTRGKARILVVGPVRHQDDPSVNMSMVPSAYTTAAGAKVADVYKGGYVADSFNQRWSITRGGGTENMRFVSKYRRAAAEHGVHGHTMRNCHFSGLDAVTANCLRDTLIEDCTFEAPSRLLENQGHERWGHDPSLPRDRPGHRQRSGREGRVRREQLRDHDRGPHDRHRRRLQLALPLTM